MNKILFVIYYLAVFFVVQLCVLLIAIFAVVFGDKECAKDFIKSSDILDLYNIKFIKEEWRK